MEIEARNIHWRQHVEENMNDYNNYRGPASKPVQKRKSTLHPRPPSLAKIIPCPTSIALA